MLDFLLKIVEKENNRQRNEFLSVSDTDIYWEKLKNKAEFNIHFRENVCAGFVAYYCNNGVKKESFISLIMVLPEFRGERIGGGLVDHVLNISKLRGFSACSLEVKKTNKNAITLYRNKGFSIFEVQDNSFIMKVSLL